MKNIMILVFLFVLLLLPSCKKGGWKDNIHLSLKSAEFKPGGDSIIITTKGKWWWLEGVTVNDTNYFNFENVDVHSDHFRIAKDCFVVERRNLTTLFISLDENTLDTTKVVRVELEAGDYFDRVTITQEPH